ncbi:MAG: putative lipid II flippase FtsW [Methylacidiphilales bacterium]|nr:putative lipid II flippase FtsW [Candidatus Methylacidiphilales bacterium]MDW8349796.1 putative lipid II flippase FtsW [Verrucomicrobiae bacterium]
MGLAAFHRAVGYVLILTVLSLLALGLVMLYSTGAKYAPLGQSAVLAPLQKQALWLLIGLVAAIIFFLLDPQKVLAASPWLCAIGAILLIACFIPGIGKEVNAARRWVEVFGFTFQPSEWAKFAFLTFLAWRAEKTSKPGSSFSWRAQLPVIAVVALYAGLILATPDLGTAIIFCVLLVMGLFVVGLPYIQAISILLFVGVSVLVLAFFMPERRGRILAFLDPEAHRLGDAWQVWQAHIALGTGGLYGVGLGNSRQKMDYLPEANTDFIFAIIGEELGLWVSLTVVLAYVVIVLCGAWIAYHAPTFGQRVWAFGLTAAIGLQALVNLGVVTALLPNKGLPLPFISYGGSNLLFCLVSIGVLLNIHQDCHLRRQGLHAVLARHTS